LPYIVLDVNITRQVARETGRALANQCIGSEWSISDHMLEKILVKQNQQYASRAKMRQAMSVMNSQSAKRPTIRMPGGISLQSKELMELLKGCGTRGKSLIQRAREKIGSKKDLATLMGEQEESGDLPPKAIDALLVRYGEIVDESMDDPEMLRLLKAENVRRQLAMYTSQNTVREQISALCDVVSAISEHTLPEDVRDKIMGERLIRSAQVRAIIWTIFDVANAHNALEVNTESHDDNLGHQCSTHQAKKKIKWIHALKMDACALAGKRRRCGARSGIGADRLRERHAHCNDRQRQKHPKAGHVYGKRSICCAHNRGEAQIVKIEVVFHLFIIHP